MKKQHLIILFTLILGNYLSTAQTIIPENLYVQGTLLAGFDSETNIPIGFDTFILSENNTRILFRDTSESNSTFPSNDWRLQANSNLNRGDEYFVIEDATAGQAIFRLDAGAPTFSFRVFDDGSINLGRNGSNTAQSVFNLDSGARINSLHLRNNGSIGIGNNSGTIFNIDANAIGNSMVIGANQNVGIGSNTLPSTSVSLGLNAVNQGLQLNRLDNAQRAALGTALGTTEVGVIVYDTEDEQTYFWNGTSWEGDSTGSDDQNISGSSLIGTNLTIGIEGGASEIVDLSSLQDGTGTDDQALTLNVNSLELEDGGSVDLSSYLDNTDNQNISGSSFSGTDLTIGIEGGTSEIIDLSSLQDGTGTDDQALTLNVNSLDLEDGGSVDLSGYLDNTDDQALSLNVNSLDLEDGGSVDLSGYLDNTDNQQLNLNGNTLELDNSVSVDLTGYLDNTDNQNISGSSLVGNDLTIGISGGASETVDLSSLNNSGTDDQQLSLNGNSLDLENGGSVDLSGYLDNTDGQQLGNFILSGPILSIAISEGATTNFGPNTATRNVTSVNLSPLIDSLEDQIDALESENAAQQAQIDDLIARVEAIEDCACDGTLAVSDFNVETDQPVLRQNIPNPFDNTTSIGYFIPLTYAKANIVVSNVAGQILNNVPITKFGEGEITISKNRLQSAVYFYTLFVDGKRVASKRMVVE